MTGLGRRVVHLASGREWRGGQNQVLLLARTLAGCGGVDQVVVTGRGTPLARRLGDAGVPVRGVSWRAGLSPAALLGTLREAARGPSLLHAHDAHAAALAALAGALSGSPWVATRRAAFPLRRPWLWSRAARIIAVSDAVRRALLADGLAPERIVRVYSGIDLDAIRSARPEGGGIRRKLDLAEEVPLAVAVGALGPDKDHATLLAAAAALRARHPELHWAIAGEGPLRAELEARIRWLGLGDRVRLLGHLDQPLPLIAAANVFVMSSREEGLGTSVLDAMALDVPVAATRAGGIPEMLERGAGLLSPPGDGVALADSIAELLEDRSRRECVVAAARARVSEFSVATLAGGVLSVYRSVTEGVDIK
ncbi:MAG TPA: glycosyltransferase [Gemmatimonadales bacterium]|nr:glycosyltransferase [Gemmatimonadales bacterium]